MAGFQVYINGRFWVSTEDGYQQDQSSLLLAPRLLGPSIPGRPRPCRDRPSRHLTVEVISTPSISGGAQRRPLH